MDAAIAWTKTLLASSAEIRDQPATLPLFSLATRVPAEFIQRASSGFLSSLRSTSRYTSNPSW